MQPIRMCHHTIKELENCFVWGAQNKMTMFSLSADNVNDSKNLTFTILIFYNSHVINKIHVIIALSPLNHFNNTVLS